MILSQTRDTLRRLDAHQIGMIVDRGDDFPSSIQSKLNKYGSEMWHFRDHPGLATTRGLNSYDGDLRGSIYFSNSQNIARCSTSFSGKVINILPLGSVLPPETVSVTSLRDLRHSISYAHRREQLRSSLKFVR